MAAAAAVAEIGRKLLLTRIALELSDAVPTYPENHFIHPALAPTRCTATWATHRGYRLLRYGFGCEPVDSRLQYPDTDRKEPQQEELPRVVIERCRRLRFCHPERLCDEGQVVKHAVHGKKVKGQDDANRDGCWIGLKHQKSRGNVEQWIDQ